MKYRIVSMCAAAGAMLTATRAEATEASPPTKPLDRPEWVWINGEGGISTANLTAFNADVNALTVDLVPTVGAGPAAGLGAGVRLVFVTLGARGRMSAMQGGGREWQLWTLDAEAGVRVPLRPFEPYLTLSGGYASLANFGTAVSGLQSGLNISGANVRVGAGLDIYATHLLSIGGYLTAEMLILARQGVPLRDLAEAKQVGSISEAQARILEGNGTSFGGALTFGVVIGLHF